MTIDSFTHTPLAITIYFGAGRFQEIGSIVESHKLKRVLVLSTGSERAITLANRAGEQIGDRLSGYFTECVEQVPPNTAAKVQAQAKALNVDGVICVGGGSTIGHGKAVAVEQEIKLFHVVTTYSGSEMTSMQGFTKDGVKRVVRDKRMAATGVIYDPELTVSLPPQVSGPSGMNAMAHCVEALYGEKGNPIVSAMAVTGIRSLAAALPEIVADPSNLHARGEALIGAHMSGTVIPAGVGLHHAVAHVLGGSFGIPHAIAHSVALPHTIAYNRPAVPVAMTALADALSSSDGPQGLFDLSLRLGIDMSLANHGFDRGKIDKAISLLLDHPIPNPRSLERPSLTIMFEDMIDGVRPNEQR